MVVLATPVAHVAEVFEYDVLRALNTPLVVKRAQAHFGQQLLAHLHTLDWGFRINGTVIHMRLVMGVGVAALMAVVASISQSLSQFFVPA